MAIFNALIPSFSADVVAINGPAGQMFRDARPMKATVSETAKLMTHPLENGSSIVDHRIILPIAIQIQLILRSNTYRETYQQIRQAFRASVQMSIQTKTDTYPNMYLQAMPHEEDPSMFDTITILLEFVEAMFVQVQLQDLPPTAVSEPTDQSTLDRGEQGATDAGDQASDLFRIFN